MRLAQLGEDQQHDEPDADKENDGQHRDGPRRGVPRAPEVTPAAPVKAREEVVLENNRDEHPEDEFAAEQGFVEVRDFARGLAVVGWEGCEEEGSDCEEEDAYWAGYGG